MSTLIVVVCAVLVLGIAFRFTRFVAIACLVAVACLYPWTLVPILLFLAAAFFFHSHF